MLSNYIHELAQDHLSYMNKYDEDNNITYTHAYMIALSKVVNTILNQGYIILNDNNKYYMEDLNNTIKNIK